MNSDSTFTVRSDDTDARQTKLTFTSVTIKSFLLRSLLTLQKQYFAPRSQKHSTFTSFYRKPDSKKHLSKFFKHET